MKRFVFLLTALAILQLAVPSLYSGRTPTAVVRTATGSETAGIRKSTWIFSASFSGTVLGVAFPASSSIDIDAPNGETLNAIAYTISAGTITIIEIR